MITSWSWKIKLPKPLHIDGFDSALEFSWNHLLETLGLSPYHHPESVFLPESGRHYEPDFLLPSPTPTLYPDTYAEAKGDLTDRVYKPIEFQKHYKFPTILLLSPFIPPESAYNSLEVPWSDWKPINTRHIVLRPHRGFIEPPESQYGDYVPGTLYYRLSETLREFYQPLPFPHYSMITDD